MQEKCALGLRVFRKITRPTPAELQALTAASVGDISDVVHGRGVVDSGISPRFVGSRRVFGPAITVEVSPGDGMMLRAAVDVAEPGDVIVVNAHGVTSRAVLGGVIGMHMVQRGVAGLIVDGAVRDVAEFETLGLPVMARAVTPRSGTTSSGWGEVNVPIACGGAVVNPGDVVIADDEGIVFVPRQWISEIAASIGHAGHPMYAPGDILDKLAALPPRANVLGIEAVTAAIEKHGGLVVDGTYDEDRKDRG